MPQRSTTPEGDALLEVRDVTTTFLLPSGPLQVVTAAEFDVHAGEALGIVGESGSGKSVLARTVYGLLSGNDRVATSGSVRFEGRELMGLPRDELRRLWGDEIAMVFQDPMTSLNPVVRIGRQVVEHVQRRTRMTRAAARELGVSLLSRLGVPDPDRRMDEYPHQLSGGLRQRVAIAAALAGSPRLVIADEPTTALDVTIQAQILRLLDEARRRDGVALLLITHDLGVVADHTDTVLVMYAGRIVERAPTRELFANPRMPYSAALMEAAPRLEDPPHSVLAAIPGQPPALDQIGSGCPFAPRCPRAQDRCRTERPSLESIEPDRWFACWFPLADGERLPVRGLELEEVGDGGDR